MLVQNVHWSLLLWIYNAVTYHISYLENENVAFYSPVSRKIFFGNYSQSKEERLAIKGFFPFILMRPHLKYCGSVSASSEEDQEDGQRVNAPHLKRQTESWGY